MDDIRNEIKIVSTEYSCHIYHSAVFIWGMTLIRDGDFDPSPQDGSLYCAVFLDYLQKHSLFLLNSMLKVKTLSHPFLYCMWTYSLIISLKKDDNKFRTPLSFDDYVADGSKSASGTQMNLQVIPRELRLFLCPPHSLLPSAAKAPAWTI